ncbi:MAG: DUF2232 domain-containing protein [Desulfitobacterium hafniense]|nr:DUF2232 domain-containing protein [Desulfitobacterium hafniense]
MYISDRKTSDFLSQLALVILPWLGIAWGAWGWILEVVLLLSVLWIGKSKGLLTSVLLLSMGYLAALVYYGAPAFLEIGYVPFAGLAINFGRSRSWPVKDLFFMGLVAAGLLGALPTIYLARVGVDPQLADSIVNTTIEQYKAAGMLSAMQEQGVNEVQLRSYMRIALNYYFLLIPALVTLINFIKFGLVYLLFTRLFPEPGGGGTSFSRWQLPWYAVWGAILGLALYLIGDEYNLLAYKNLGLNLILVYAGLALVLGISIYTFFLRNTKLPLLFKWIMIVGSFLYLQFSMLTLILFGLFDLVFNFRRLPDNGKEGS